MFLIFETKTAHNMIKKSKIRGLEPWTSKYYEPEVSLSTTLEFHCNPPLICSSQSLEYRKIFSPLLLHNISDFEIQRI